MKSNNKSAYNKIQHKTFNTEVKSMKIKWALSELKKYQDSPLTLNGSVDLEKSLKERDSDVIAASPVFLDGIITVDEKSVYYVDMTLKVKVTLPSSRSLEPVDVSMEIPFSEIYLAPDSPVSLEQFSEDEFGGTIIR
ncbi:MAG: hypothetical protein U5K84_01655 [Alkalibacterium sp.]|nr:hypothetical protein [Alkalibacterium sp.]